MTARMHVRVAFAALFGVAVVAGVASMDLDARAQQRGGAPRTNASSRSSTPRSPAPPAIDAGVLAAAPLVAPPGAGAADAGLIASQQLDGGAQVFHFGEIDIEGRLKSPQLVYFLRRVRAEFAAGDLGHRSFLRELSETRKRPSF